MSLDINRTDDGGIFLKGSGILKYDDVAGVNRILYATPETIRGLRYQISDYTEVSEIRLDAEEIRELARQDAQASRSNPDMLIAVVGSDDLMFGVLRMWNAYASAQGFETRVFRDLAEARIWIALRLEEKGNGGT